MTGKPLPTQTALLIRGLALIAVFVAAGFALRALEAGEFLNTAWIDANVREHGVVGAALFIAAGAAFTAFGLSRQVVCFLGGYAYGFVAGTALALTATVLGCTVAFLFARLVAREVVTARLKGRVQRADRVLGKNPFSLILMIRLLPVGSNLMTNLVAGVSSAALLPFVAASAVGHLPQTLVFTLVGSGINVHPEIRITLGVVLFVLSMALGTHLYFRLRKDAALRAAIDAAGAGGGGNGGDDPQPSPGSSAPADAG